MVPKVTENVDVLRQGWVDAASSLAPHVEGLREALEEGLTNAQHADSLDEQTLLGAIDGAMQRTGSALAPDVGQTLVRRLQRNVYEYLLSLDAALPQEEAFWPERQHDEGTVLYGAEEVAALRGAELPPPAEPYEVPPVVADVPAPETAEPLQMEEATQPEQAGQDEPPPVPAPEPSVEAGHAPEAQPFHIIETNAPAWQDMLAAAGKAPTDAASGTAVQAPIPVEPEASPEPEEVPEPPEPVEPAAAAPAGATADKAPRRFAIFGRSGNRAPQPPPRRQPNPETAPPAEAAPAPEHQTVGYRVLDSPPAAAAEPEAEAPMTDEFEVSQPALPRPEESLAPLAGGETFIAPREGFHIREDIVPFVISTPSDLVSTPRPAPPTASPAASENEPASEPAAAAESRGWSVRDDPATAKRSRPDAGGGHTSFSREDDDAPFASEAVIDARHKIEERLGRRRCGEAAALVQKLAQDPGGRAVAELGLDAGDRCRALGKNNSALSCYLAATRADPVFDQPLLRLADICIDDHDIDLAVAYLERVARFYRLGGDHHAAMRILRKIATIAPYRDDILSMLVRVQSTGRFEDE